MYIMCVLPLFSINCHVFGCFLNPAVFDHFTPLYHDVRRDTGVPGRWTKQRCEVGVQLKVGQPGPPSGSKGLIEGHTLRETNPISSMYGVFTYIWLFLMVKYGKCR